MKPDTSPQTWQTDQADRRADKRTATKIDARLEHAGGVLDGQVVDISFGGAKFVTLTTEPKLATETRVMLRLAAGPQTGPEELRWDGAVVRDERSGDDGPERIAYAIAFDESAPLTLDELDGVD